MKAYTLISAAALCFAANLARATDSTASWPVIAAQRSNGDTWAVQPKSVQPLGPNSFRATIARTTIRDKHLTTTVYLVVVTRCGQPRGELLLLTPEGKQVEPLTIWESARSDSVGALIAKHVCREGSATR